MVSFKILLSIQDLPIFSFLHIPHRFHDHIRVREVWSESQAYKILFLFRVSTPLIVRGFFLRKIQVHLRYRQP